MILQEGEYRIDRAADEGIWISRKVLEDWREHYYKVADKEKHKYKHGNNTFRYPFYVGKAEVLTDLIKMFYDLEGE